MNEPSRRRNRARAALCAALPVLWVLMVGVAGPVHAQTNSPSGGQPTGSTPSQGGTGSNSGPNVGGDTQAGNRTTPGNGGATGGGSSGAGDSDTADGGKAGVFVGVAGVLLVAAIAAGIATRHRRVMETAGAGGGSASR
jgi:hypothetical protein